MSENKRVCIAGAALLFACSVQATDWSGYEAGADITLGAGEHVVANASDFAKVDALGKITVGDETSRIVFAVPDGEVWRLNGSITGAGGIVKRGGGELHFEIPADAASPVTDYQTDCGISIEAGWLFCPTNNQKTIKFHTGPVDVSAGAVLVTTSTANRSSTAPGSTEVDGLTGSGTVTNFTVKQLAQLILAGARTEPKVFSGKIAGEGIRIMLWGPQHFTGTESNYRGSTEVFDNRNTPSRHRGLLGISKFGEGREPSSIGAGTFVFRETCGKLLYLGTGETTDKTLKLYTKSGYNGVAGYIDAGATGGITFTGEFLKAGSRAERFVLTGSNTAPCIVSGAIYDDDADNTPLYLVKQGTGTWRFVDHDERRNNGVIAVEEGRLQFTSIADTNVVCSLGLANALQSAYTGDYDASKNVDYAYLLGTGTTRGTMEYVGEEDAVCSNRVFAVKGEGAIVNGAAEGVRLDLRGAMNAPGETGTLVLAGTNRTRCVFANVADSPSGGRLGLTKEGSGVWRLEGVQDFSGPLTVKEGTLEVQGAATNLYRHYRFVIRGNMKCHGMSNSAVVTYLKGLVFYDEEGVNQTPQSKMTYVKGTDYVAKEGGSAGDWENLQPGEYSWARPGTFQLGGDYDIDKLFAISRTIRAAWKRPGDTWAQNPDLDDETKWIPIQIRLPEDAGEVVAFDVAALWGDSACDLADWSLMASVDGTEWKEVARYDYDSTHFPGASSWFSDLTAIGDDPAGTVRKDKGYPIPASVVHDDVSALQNVSAVKVAPGAVLKAHGRVTLPMLTVDCGNGNGTIDGFEIADEGVIDFVGLDAGTRAKEIAIAFANISDDGLAKMNDRERWTVNFDGERSDWFNVTVMSDGIKVSRKGLMISIR